MIVEGAREVEGIIQSLLTLADPKRLHLAPVATESLLHEATAAALREVSTGDQTSWDVSHSSDLEYLVVDRIQVRQALRNLVANALQAQPNGGAVEITVRADNVSATISVSDDGMTWYPFPCDLTDPPYPGCAGTQPTYSNPDNEIDATDPSVSGGNSFDLADVGLTVARYIRIADSGLGLGPIGPSTGGFDLDAVAIIHGTRP